MSNLLSSPRDAVAADLPGLLMLEAGFPGDRLSARQYRHHIGNPAARLRVMIDEARVVASSLCLFRRGSRLARLYSLVVDPALRGQGLGARLLSDAEAGALARGCDRLRLEVRADNRAAIALYLAAGFAPIGRVPGYYQDGAEALRMEKRLAA